MIDYALLSYAASYYSKRGYSEIEVPWLVDVEYANLTCPPGGTNLNVPGLENKCLVCSGEQGFLSLAKTLSPGKYFTITPCFRKEPVLNRWYKTGFMKLELFSPEARDTIVQTFISDAMQLFLERLPYEDTNVAVTHEGFDIEYKTIELGSYGKREGGEIKWTYGTGLAEPRFSECLKLSYDDMHVE
jgi:hypothetical protein